MNLLLRSLFLCQLLVVCLLEAKTLSRKKRYIGQFGDMIRYSTDREALLYNSYGNHCGFNDDPDLPAVDALDRCCYQHDRCYDVIRDGVCSSHWLGPNWVMYDWRWQPTARKLYCEDDPDSCDFATCECDRTAAECFARNVWHEENKRPSKYDKFAAARFKAFQWFGTWMP